MVAKMRIAENAVAVAVADLITPFSPVLTVPVIAARVRPVLTPRSIVPFTVRPVMVASVEAAAELELKNVTGG
jgi:hypothetical protein